MIKFFRNIRRTYISKNRFSKYLLYALGEIILVVIGILIALQVNNWNETTKTKAEETILKTNLKEAIRIAGLEANRFVEAEESNIIVLEKLLQNWETLSYNTIKNQFRPFQNNNFSPLFNLSSYSQFYDPGADVYNTAVSDGSISIIQDAKFVQRLDVLYNYVVPRVNELLKEEYLLSQTINNHIAVRYETIFLEGSVLDSTLIRPRLWNDDTYKKLFLEMRKDGILKYKIAHRLELKRSRLLLIGQAKAIINSLLTPIKL